MKTKKNSISKDKPNVFWCFLVECLDIASFDVPLSVIANFTHSLHQGQDGIDQETFRTHQLRMLIEKWCGLNKFKSICLTFNHAPCWRKVACTEGCGWQLHDFYNEKESASQHSMFYSSHSPMFWGLFLHCITEVHIMCTHTYIILYYQIISDVWLRLLIHW